MDEKRNKYREWKHDATRSASRKKIKRLASKADRRNSAAGLRESSPDPDDGFSR
jgi:hypothetical protein